MTPGVLSSVAFSFFCNGGPFLLHVIVVMWVYKTVRSYISSLASMARRVSSAVSSSINRMPQDGNER